MSKVVARSTGKPFTTRMSARCHTWVADEPPGSGGQDIGATPFEQFVGSLAACAVITAQMYAGRKEWPLESIAVEAEHRMIDARDCPDCATEKGRILEVSFTVHIEGPLSDEQRSRLHDIVGRCPVKRAVEGEARFLSELV